MPARTAARPERPTGDPLRFRGVRVFDISNLDAPVQVATVQSCRGSHTHTLLKSPSDDENIYVYVTGQAASARRPRWRAARRCRRDAADDAAVRRGAVAVADRGDQGPAGCPAERGGRQRPAADARYERPVRSTASRTRRRRRCIRRTRTGRRRRATRLVPRHHDATRRSGWPPAPVRATGSCSTSATRRTRSGSTRSPTRTTPTGTGRRSPTTARRSSSPTSGAAAPPRAAVRPTTSAGVRTRSTTSSTQAGLPQLLQAAGPPRRSRRTASPTCRPSIPVPGRDIMVQAWYQGGAVGDRLHRLGATRRRSATTTAGRSAATSLVLGGLWSTYYYNGAIYGSEIARGFDAWKLTPTAELSANEIKAATEVQLERLTPQHQPQFIWEPSFAVVRSYLDQLVRAGRDRRDGPPAVGEVHRRCRGLRVPQTSRSPRRAACGRSRRSSTRPSTPRSSRPSSISRRPSPRKGRAQRSTPGRGAARRPFRVFQGRFLGRRADRGQRLLGGRLLGFLLRAPGARAELLAVDLGGAGEVAFVGRAFDVEHEVRDAPARLRERFLELRLVIDMGRARVLDPVGEGGDDRRLDRLVAVLEEERRDRGLEQRRERRCGS